MAFGGCGSDYCLFVFLFVCLFIYLLTQAGFSGSYAADVGLRPTAIQNGMRD